MCKYPLILLSLPTPTTQHISIIIGIIIIIFVGPFLKKYHWFQIAVFKNTFHPQNKFDNCQESRTKADKTADINFLLKLTQLELKTVMLDMLPS